MLTKNAAGLCYRQNQGETLKSLITSCKLPPLSNVMDNQTIEFQSDDLEACYYRAMMLANLGCYEEALASVEQALEIQPDNLKAWILRGGVLTHLNCYQEALTCFEQALKIQPDDKDACLFRGLTLHHLGRYKQAYASYDRVLGIEHHSTWNDLIERLKVFLKLNRFGKQASTKKNYATKG
jgi:tetratricopeptide (TPR) repeat protein